VKVARLDDIPSDFVSSSRWKPIRSTLGIEAFGINAYEALEAGEVLIPEHDETEDLAGEQRHQELYLVLRGRARFVVDGQDIDGVVGTLVFVDDPASRRAAVAVEPGTLILAIGGPAGEAYEPPPWEELFLNEVRARRPT
jgi:hypothetical protein